jgi:hypothetical protein
VNEGDLIRHVWSTPKIIDLEQRVDEESRSRLVVCRLEGGICVSSRVWQYASKEEEVAAFLSAVCQELKRHYIVP